MVALAMSSEEQHLVDGVGRSLCIECIDLLLELLPLRELCRQPIRSRIVALDQAEVVFRLGAFGVSTDLAHERA